MKDRTKARNDALKYAKENPNEVSLSWIDGSIRKYDEATKAVELCFIHRTAQCIMGAVCADKLFENMLNDLLDLDS